VTFEVQDHYFKQAKRDGYVSRAAYKLIEIDDRKKLLAPGDAVLDCGAAPGSWLQVTAQRVGSSGRVVGVDLTTIRSPLPANVRTIVGDFTTIDSQTLRHAAGDVERFDVILSDMAPSTSGDRSSDHHGSARLCNAVLDRCADLLRPGGHCVMKVLEGETYPDLLRRTGELFDSVKGFKPAASRSHSTEIYIIAQGWRNRATQPLPAEQVKLAPRGGPSRGWGNKQS
jgi:23S rRNA (uridine2552-2'-O)-methyltransferase